MFEYLELIEKDYFGLQFVDIGASSTKINENEAVTSEADSNAHLEKMKWIDATKTIRKQMQCPPYVLYFRVKFYVSDPGKLQEEYTRYHFYLQVRKDLRDGRLVCPESTAAMLGSYAAQCE